MSEQTAAPVPAAPAQGVNPNPEPQGDPVDEALGEGGKKAIAAEREARKAAEKAVNDLTAKLKAVEDAKLGDLERAQKQAAEAQAALAEVTRQNLRNSVALAKGVPADLVEFLTGDNEADIAKRADVLLARLNAPTSPKPDPSQGAGSGKGKGSTADSFAEFFATQLH